MHKTATVLKVLQTKIPVSCFSRVANKKLYEINANEVHDDFLTTALDGVQTLGGFKMMVATTISRRSKISR